MIATEPEKSYPQIIISKLLTELGAPWLSVHHEAIEAVEEDNTEKLCLLSATNLDDSFYRDCGYISSIPKLSPTVVVWFAESARAIVDTQRERTMHRLNSTTIELLE